ncbi:MAG: radical SAM protein [Candidatus Omnitrophota bacterium]|nr:radical SAM protein [Candidatus Omnitrophota bacterium]
MADNRVDIVIINPGSGKKMYGSLSSCLSAIEPPIWGGMTAAFLRQKGFSVRIIDAHAEELDAEAVAEKVAGYNPMLADIVVCGSNPSASSTPKMVETRHILDALKKKAPRVKRIASGIHPSALPEKTLREESVDFVCKGEGFYAILGLLEILKTGGSHSDYDVEGLWYLKDGKVMSNGWSETVRNLDELPFVAWDLLPMEKYRAHNWHCFDNIEARKPYAVIYTTLGCPFNCRFCNIHALYSGKPGIRFRSPAKIVEEIDFLVKNYKVRNIKILDELFVLKESFVTEICDLIIRGGYDLNIWAYARIDTINEKLLKKMKQAGINWLAFGIESASEKVRSGVVKGAFGEDKISEAVRMTHAAGIHIVANFIFGLPDDDFTTMQKTLDMAKELNCEYTNFYTAMAYPGSQLYDDMARQGVKLSENWLSYSQFSAETQPLSTRYLSSADVLRFRDKAFDEYHNSPRYLEMMEEKFGSAVMAHIREMLTHKIHRKFA